MTGKSVKAFQTASKTAVAVAEACMCKTCGKAVSGDHVCQRVYLRVIEWRGR